MSKPQTQTGVVNNQPKNFAITTTAPTLITIKNLIIKRLTIIRHDKEPLTHRVEQEKDLKKTIQIVQKDSIISIAKT